MLGKRLFSPAALASVRLMKGRYTALESLPINTLCSRHHPGRLIKTYPMVSVPVLPRALSVAEPHTAVKLAGF